MMIRISIVSCLLFSSLGFSAESRFLSDAELSASYNNNVFLTGDKEQILGTSEEVIEQDLQTQLLLGTSYKFYDAENSDSKIIIDFFHENLQKNDINTSIGSVELPWSYYAGDYRFRIIPKISQYGLDGESILSYFGSQLDMTKKYGNNQLGLSYVYTKSNANDESYSSYSGDNQKFSIHYSRRQSIGRFNLRVGKYAQNYHDVVAIDDRYAGYFMSTRLLLSKKRFKLSLAAQLKTKKFTSSFDSDVARSDVNAGISISPAYRVTKSMGVYSKLSYTKNVSNISEDYEDNNYAQTLMTMGLRLSF